MPMKSHLVIAVAILLYISIEQMLNLFIESYYDVLGAEGAFKVWWTWHLVEKFIFFFVKNVILFFDAKRNFPEFSGNFGSPFPGQEPPRSLKDGT